MKTALGKGALRRAISTIVFTRNIPTVCQSHGVVGATVFFGVGNWRGVNASVEILIRRS